MRASVRGEFTSALDSLSSERASLLSEVSELRYKAVRQYDILLVLDDSHYRLKLSEAMSEKAAIEKEKRREADAEVREIHQR